MLLERCLGYGQQQVLQGKLHSAESVTLELFRNALKLADNKGLLAGTGLFAMYLWWWQGAYSVVTLIGLWTLVCAMALFNLYSASYPPHPYGMPVYLKQCYFFLIGFAVVIFILAFSPTVNSGTSPAGV